MDEGEEQGGKEREERREEGGGEICLKLISQVRGVSRLQDSRAGKKRSVLARRHT